MTIEELYLALTHKFGKQNWWPADNNVEMLLGMVLVQNTSWVNVEKSLLNIKKHTGFDPKKIIELKDSELQLLIKPSGFYKSKSTYIRNILSFYENEYLLFKECDTGKIRTKLLSIKGIGNETADVILLYLFDRCVFVADSYAKKIFSELLEYDIKKISYSLLKVFVEKNSNLELEQYKEFHALIIEYGKSKDKSLCKYRLIKNLRDEFHNLIQ